MQGIWCGCSTCHANEPGSIQWRWRDGVYRVQGRAEPGAECPRDDSPANQLSQIALIADASLFRVLRVAYPTGLNHISQLSRMRRLGVRGSVEQALALPPWAEYGGEVEIWGLHKVRVGGVVVPTSRRARVLGYSTKEINSSIPGGAVDSISFARTVVYVAELVDCPSLPGPPLVHGDSGGSVTQRVGGIGPRRLHSLVGARAWSSGDGGLTKRWFVLLIPNHFAVAQIARLLRDQHDSSAAATSHGRCGDVIRVHHGAEPESIVTWVTAQELSLPTMPP